MADGALTEVSPGARDAAGPLMVERVLDLSTGVGGAFCAKLLGDLGADVVKVEKPGIGDPLRLQPPFPGPVPDREANPQFLYFNTSKRSVTLDVTAVDGHDVLRRLIERYDVVVADGPEPELAGHGIGFAVLQSWNPATILTTISGFGSSGPYRDYGSTHLIACALGGWADACRTPGREPLQSGGSLTDTVSGAYAAVATLAAIEGRARDGGGDHVDVSDWEAALTCAMGPTLMYEYRNELGAGRSDYMTGPSFNLRCKDGYVGVNVLTEAQWETLCTFVGRPDLADDERFADYFGRSSYVDEIRPVLEAALADREAEEIFHEAQLWRLPFGLVVSPQQALELDVHRDRDYFEEHEHTVAGSVRTPRMPFVMSASPSRPRRAPMLGEHTEQVLVGELRLPHTVFDDLRGRGIV